MSASPSTPVAATETTAALPVERIPSAEIDASLRWPVLAFAVSSVAWLLFGRFCSCWRPSSFTREISGGYPADSRRIRPATNAISLLPPQAGLAALFWLLCRLGNMRFAYQIPVLIAGKLWNVGVLWSGGHSGRCFGTGLNDGNAPLRRGDSVRGLCRPWLMRRRHVSAPGASALSHAMVFVRRALLVSVVVFRREYLLVIEPVRGVFQSVVAAWFAGIFAALARPRRAGYHLLLASQDDGQTALQRTAGRLWFLDHPFEPGGCGWSARRPGASVGPECRCGSDAVPACRASAMPSIGYFTLLPGLVQNAAARFIVFGAGCYLLPDWSSQSWRLPRLIE